MSPFWRACAGKSLVIWAAYALLASAALGQATPEFQQNNSVRGAPLGRATAMAHLPISGDGLFAGRQQLELNELIALVEARNPNVQAMVAAWRAAAARYPQAVSLDDPMFMAMAAPASFASNRVDDAYVLQGSQRIPTNGKRHARGRIVQGEVGSAFAEVADARLQIREAATIAYFDYYLVERQLELNARNRSAVNEFRSAAQAQYQANRATEQDVLQADVELTELDVKQIELERMRGVAQARLNTLLLRAPDESLPPPPQSLSKPAPLPSAELLRGLAMSQRPDLASLSAKIRMEQASLDLARREYTPDIDVFGRYDSFWQPASQFKDLRGQVGLNMNLPRYSKRDAAMREAGLRVSQRRAEYEQRMADIQLEVQTAYEQVRESIRTVDLYDKRFLPIAQQNVASARSNYNVAKVSFLNLIESQRQLIALRDRQQQAVADYYRRLAQLERAIGGPLPVVPTVESLPPVQLRPRGTPPY